MARPTQLKVLAERPVPPGTVIDGRTVEDAFPPAPGPVEPQLGADILELLRKHNERVSGDIARVESVATVAAESAAATAAKVAHTEEVLAKTTADAAALQAGQRAAADAIGQLATVVRTQQPARAAAVSLAARALEAAVTRLAGAALFIADRLPALGSLAAAAWLWGRSLPDPQPLQLCTLALWLPVVGISFWWGRRS